MTKGTLPPTWIPLKGAKSGQVYVTANFDPLDGRFSSPDAAGALVDDSRKLSSDNDGKRSSQSNDGRKSSGSGTGEAAALKNKLLGGNTDYDEGLNPGDLPEGTLHLDVLGAKNLPKSDLIGKSDPYAEIALGDQVYRTVYLEVDLCQITHIDPPNVPALLDYKIFAVNDVTIDI